MGASGHGAHGAHGATAGHGTRKEYLIGFALSVVLTAIPFWLVMTHTLTGAQAVFAVMGLGAVQVVVHMIYFLHMNSRSEGGWTMLALLFTVLMVGIVLSGSVWVMHHLDVNMMPPMSPQAMRQMP
jgi:cytochrome o ubiquinol oxidase operon protein cyoD